MSFLLLFRGQLFDKALFSGTSTSAAVPSMEVSAAFVNSFLDFDFGLCLLNLYSLLNDNYLPGDILLTEVKKVKTGLPDLDHQI